jgi:hypothetical protein
VVSASVAVFLWQRYRTGAGLNDLVIDLERDVFSLPQTFGRDGSAEYPLDSIVGVDVDEETRSDDNGSHSVYLPKFVFTRSDGSEARETLIEWQSRERAEALADWLNERLKRKSSES